MTFSSFITKKYEIQAYDTADSSLEYAVYRWVVEGHLDKLNLYLKKHPDEFELSPATDDFYRGLVLIQSQFDQLLEGKSIEKTKHPIESWSEDQKVAEEFVKEVKKGSVGVVLKKKPKKVILKVCNYIDDEQFVDQFCHEEEWIAFAEPHTLKDVLYAIDHKRKKVWPR